MKSTSLDIKVNEFLAQKRIAVTGVARAMKQVTTAGGEDYCGMCGRDWCALRLSRQVKEKLESAPNRGGRARFSGRRNSPATSCDLPDRLA